MWRASRTDCADRTDNAGSTGRARRNRVKICSLDAPALSHSFIYDPWVEELSERTNGRLKVTLFGGGVMGKPPDHLELALSGTADISFIDAGAFTGVFPLFEEQTLPMLYPTSEVAAATSWDLIQKYMVDTEFKEVKVLFTQPTGMRQITTATKPVHVLEDLEGMKIGTTSTTMAKTLERLGAVPVIQPPGNLYTSLERGLVDGVESNWEATFGTWKYYDVTKYRTDGINLGVPGPLVVMNLDSWNNLPPDIQKVIEETSGPVLSRKTGALFDELCLKNLEKIKAYDKQAGNPEVYVLPAAERARWKAAIQPILDEWVAEKEAAGLPGEALMADLLALVEKYSK